MSLKPIQSISWSGLLGASIILGNLIAGGPGVRLAGAATPSPSTSAKTKIPPMLKWPLTEAKVSGKKVLVNFHADWCGPCKKIEAVIARPEIQRIVQDRFVWVEINEKETYAKPIREMYGVHSFPAILVLNADGSVMDHLLPKNTSDFHEPEKIIEALRIADQGLTVAHYWERRWQKLDPKNRTVEFAYNIFSILVSRGDEKNSLRWLKRVEALEKSAKNQNEDTAKAIFFMGAELYLAVLGEEAKALTYFRRLQVQYPGSLWSGAAAKEEAQILWNVGEKEKARKIFLDLLRRVSDNWGVRHYYAQFCLEKNWNKEEARKILQEGLLLPQDAKTHEVLKEDLKTLTP